MKVLFCIFENNEALGLRLIHAIASNRHECKMLFINDYDTDLILQSIKEFAPDVLGFSLVSANWEFYKTLYPLIRKVGKFKILIGGWQATLGGEENKSYCDIVCRGEAENVIMQILDDVKNNNYVREYIGTRADVTDFQKHPFSLLDKNGTWSSVIEDGLIKQTDPYYTNYRYGITIGRGCPHSCTYCSNCYMKNLYPGWGKIRYRKYGSVLNELKWAKNKLPNVNTVVFFDEIFMPPRDGRKEFFQEYKTSIGLPFYVLFYPGTCSDEFAKELKDAGIAGVWLGIQSGSEKIRRMVFNRCGSDVRILKQAEIFANNGIKARYDFIFSNPFDSIETLEETRTLIKKLPMPNSINAFRMKFFPNTKLTQMAIDAGLTDKDDIKRRLDSTWRDIVVSVDEIDKLIDEEIYERSCNR